MLPKKIKEKISKRKMPKWLKAILCLLLVVLVLIGIYAALANAGYIKALQLAWQIQQQNALNQEDKAILGQLSKILLLPETATPTMAVITDVATLQKQQPGFFANAKNGDHLIIYPDMAIIFDAQANKIIKVGAVQLAQAPVTAPVNFAIYNSLKNDSANVQTDAMETKIKAAFNNAVVTVRANSAKADYAQTLVIDLVGNNPDMAKIAQAAGGKVSTLPAGEAKPANAAVLVIIGKQ